MQHFEGLGAQVLGLFGLWGVSSQGSGFGVSCLFPAQLLEITLVGHVRYCLIPCFLADFGICIWASPP